MRVHLKPTGLYSQAMVRVARALKCYAPDSIEVVDDPTQADLRVLHVIGRDSLNGSEDRPRAIIQYCYQSAGGSDWPEQWAKSKIVWSYYDLRAAAPDIDFAFYYAPLGIDKAFVDFEPNGTFRDLGLLTSGYVSAPCAEAIEEATWACVWAGKPSVHLGPPVIEGMSKYPVSWTYRMGVSDLELAGLYGRSCYVSGLRHVEGFEMPAIEGMACGARPILFDRPEARHWYDGHAVFVPECHGDELVRLLTPIIRREPRPISPAERKVVLARFDWETIAKGFWECLL